MILNTISISDMEKESEFSHYCDFKEIAHGCNGVVFMARHRLLETYVAIKIYYFNESNPLSYDNKALQEIKKNASFRISNEQPVIFDTGIITINKVQYRYSIQEYLNAITLKEWHSRRKNYSKYIDDETMCVIQINAALGFLYSCLEMINAEKIHGDLNDGNVMFTVQKEYAYHCNNEIAEEDVDDEFGKYSTYLNDTYIIPTNVVFIDYGTSKWEETNERYGLERDIKKIRFDLELIFSHSPKDHIVSKFWKYLKYDELINCSELDWYSKRKLVVEALIRIILALYFIDSGLLSGFAKQEDNYIEDILHKRFKWDDSLKEVLECGVSFVKLDYYQKLISGGVGNYIDVFGIKQLANKARLKQSL